MNDLDLIQSPDTSDPQWWKALPYEEGYIDGDRMYVNHPYADVPLVLWLPWWEDSSNKYQRPWLRKLGFKDLRARPVKTMHAHYGLLMRWAQDGVTDVDRTVLAYIVQNGRYWTGNFYGWDSSRKGLDWWANQMHLPRKSVLTALRRLRDKGYLVKVEHEGQSYYCIPDRVVCSMATWGGTELPGVGICDL